MNEFINQYQYVLAWFVYISSGLIFSLFWWRLTRLITHRGWRELLRGISLVVIYTPWFTSEAQEHLAKRGQAHAAHQPRNTLPRR